MPELGRAPKAPPPPADGPGQWGVLLSGQDRASYPDAIRDWAAKGADSEFALTPDEVVARSQPRSNAASEGGRTVRARQPPVAGGPEGCGDRPVRRVPSAAARQLDVQAPGVVARRQRTCRWHLRTVGPGTDRRRGGRLAVRVGLPLRRRACRGRRLLPEDDLTEDAPNRARPSTLRCRRTSGSRPEAAPARAGRTRSRPGRSSNGPREHVDSCWNGCEVAGGRRGERLLDEVVARDVDRVHPVHRRAPMRDRSTEPAEPARQRSTHASNASGWRTGRRRSAHRARRRQRTEARREVDALRVQQRRAGRRRARRRRRCPSASPSLARIAVAASAARSASGTCCSTSVATATGGRRVVVEQRQHRLGQPGEVPLGDQRLVAVGVPAAVVDRAEHGRRVVGVHERARPVVDRLAGDRHVVGVHHAVDEPDEHPRATSDAWASSDRRRTARRTGLLGLGGRRVVAGDRVVGEAAQQRRGPAARRRTGTCRPGRWLAATRTSTAPGSSVSRGDVLAGGHDGEGAGGRDRRARASPR